ncbi:MAG TPA: thioredoxin domain-containing protein [Microbacteriaceae bacterium]|nr:thioredoxin domain-containing protein [Microbacteriaceae bacterium]
MRRVLVGLAGAAALLGLAACAPATAGVPGSVPPGDVVVQVPVEAVSGEPSRAVDGAFAIGSGPIVIDAWVDFFCPYCRMFEEGHGEYIRGLVERDAATLRVHPIAILDRASMGTKYSTRAANAFACVAEHAPERALDYMAHLYEIQPAEATPGLTDDQLAMAAPAAAVECIHGGWYAQWVGDWTRGALDAGVQGTPTVLVNGSLYRGRLDGPDFREFVGGATSTA